MKNKVAYFGLFTALALIFSYVEALIPFSIGIPGVKLGLANLIVVIALYKMNIKEVYFLAVARVVLAGFMFGNMFSILYSLAGGLLSVTVMYFLKKINGLSLIGVSIAGGVAHNIGQLIVAVFVVSSLNIAYYAPVLIIAGVITGMLIGIAALEMLKRIKTFRFE